MAGHETSARRSRAGPTPPASWGGHVEGPAPPRRPRRAAHRHACRGLRVPGCEGAAARPPEAEEEGGNSERLRLDARQRCVGHRSEGSADSVLAVEVCVLELLACARYDLGGADAGMVCLLE